VHPLSSPPLTGPGGTSTFSPGAFWGRPGVVPAAGGNPYINPAVGAPVHAHAHAHAVVMGSPGGYGYGWAYAGVMGGDGTLMGSPMAESGEYFPRVPPPQPSEPAAFAQKPEGYFPPVGMGLGLGEVTVDSQGKDEDREREQQSGDGVEERRGKECIFEIGSGGTEEEERDEDSSVSETTDVGTRQRSSSVGTSCYDASSDVGCSGEQRRWQSECPSRARSRTDDGEEDGAGSRLSGVRSMSQGDCAGATPREGTNMEGGGGEASRGSHSDGGSAANGGGGNWKRRQSMSPSMKPGMPSLNRASSDPVQQ
jgi:hypothetical protein